MPGRTRRRTPLQRHADGTCRQLRQPTPAAQPAGLVGASAGIRPESLPRATTVPRQDAGRRWQCRCDLAEHGRWRSLTLASVMPRSPEAVVVHVSTSSRRCRCRATRCGAAGRRTAPQQFVRSAVRQRVDQADGGALPSPRPSPGHPGKWPPMPTNAEHLHENRRQPERGERHAGRLLAGEPRGLTGAGAAPRTASGRIRTLMPTSSHSRRHRPGRTGHVGGTSVISSLIGHPRPLSDADLTTVDAGIGIPRTRSGNPHLDALRRHRRDRSATVLATKASSAQLDQKIRDAASRTYRPPPGRPSVRNDGKPRC